MDSSLPSIQPPIHHLSIHHQLNVIRPLTFPFINPPMIHPPILPSIHWRECGSYPSSLGLKAAPTTWTPVYRIATWKQTFAVTPTHTLQFPVCLTCTCLNTPAVPQLGSLFLFYWVFHTESQSVLPICGGIQPLLLAHPSVCMGKDKDIQYIPENLNVWVAVRARQRGKERTTRDISK